MEWNLVDVGTYLKLCDLGEAILCTLLVGVSAGAFFGGILVEMLDLDIVKTFNRSAIAVLLVTAMVGFWSIIPTHDKILAVKIAKLKNEVVTEETVNKTVDKIEEIAYKLECKYLGCEKK